MRLFSSFYRIEQNSKIQQIDQIVKDPKVHPEDDVIPDLNHVIDPDLVPESEPRVVIFIEDPKVRIDPKVNMWKNVNPDRGRDPHPKFVL